ncbi:MAG: hypothetical protein KA063_02100 [Firmicutes bacterium]|nr:hypothetical protein [Bacillota bacterium]
MNLVTGLHRRIAVWAMLSTVMATTCSSVGLVQESTYTLIPVIQSSYKQLAANQSVQSALQFLAHAEAAPGAEASALLYQSLLVEAGLEHVRADNAGSMLGILKGAKVGDTVVVACGARDVPALLLVIRAFRVSGVRPVVDVAFACSPHVWTMADADASSAKSLVRMFDSVGAFISLGREETGAIAYPLEGYASPEVARRGLAVQAAYAAYQALGVDPVVQELSGGVAAVPPGIPTVRMGLGGKVLGPQSVFMTIVGIAGANGVTTPFVTWSSDPCT